MDIKALTKRFIEESWNNGNFHRIDETVSPRYVSHEMQLPEHHRRGPAGVKAQVEETREAFPDLHVTVDFQLQDGDHVITHWTMTGTNSGKFMGLNPTNRKFTIKGVSIDRFENGQVVESWGGADTLGLMQQLGFVPKTQDMQQQHPGRAAQARPEAK